jgi:hypothetical protein
VSVFSIRSGALRGATLLAFGILLGSARALAQDAPKQPSAKEEGGKHDAEKAPRSAPANGSDKSSDVGKPPAAPPGATPAAPPPADTGPNPMRAYESALAKRRLAATAPLSRQRLRDDLVGIEEKLVDGRRDEAIFDLVYIVESPRFDPFASSTEGRAALFLLGDALGRAGAHAPARGYLARLLTGDPNETYYRRAARSLVDFGLESDRPELFLGDVSQIPSSAPAEVRGDVEYLRGRTEERAHRPDAALAAYAKVTPRSRFWAQATYLSGVIEVERGQLKKGENLFCRVADKKRTPLEAPLYGGSDFFRVRDLARLGLGRVAHEQYRFDDARYYYYLVPRDSDHLPEALYEASTTRYEAKDYDGSRELMDELKELQVNHAYEDEAWLMDAYIDLAQCKFPSADAKLMEFLKRYDPVRDAARKLVSDETAMKRLVEAVQTGADPVSAGVGGDAATMRTLGALLRVDTAYGRASLRLAQLDHQLSGLRGAMAEIDQSLRRIAAPKELHPQQAAPLGESRSDKLSRVEGQLAEVRRLIREAERSGKAREPELSTLRRELETLELQARVARSVGLGPGGATEAKSADLPDLLQADRERATRMYADAEKVRAGVVSQQLSLAKDAMTRLDKRLSRLLRRARLGRIETVLGRKRALEIEIEALAQGLLPQTVVDSLDAERYLRDDEEYWPFEGEDWEDEYVGGEGLR